jgi:hypothetical protein
MKALPAFVVAVPAVGGAPRAAVQTASPGSRAFSELSTPTTNEP